MSNIDKLEEIGFENRGEWSLEDGKIKYNILNDLQSNFLYAFVVDSDIKYIGKSIGNIKKSLNNILNQEKIRVLIKKTKRR